MPIDREELRSLVLETEAKEVFARPEESGHGLKEGGKSPYGLNHMAGNAAEWVSDWYDRDYYQNSPKKNPTGPAQGEKRVLRGGSWADLPLALRVTARISAEPEFEDRTIGFRCAMPATGQ